MTDFAERYREAYAAIGRPLKRQDGIAHKELIAAENRRLYFEPLQAARKDWRVVKIRNASHRTCREKPQFQDQIVRWLAKQASD